MLSGEEAELNSLMELRLTALLDESGPWSQLVYSVARGKEMLSFDGSHLEKRPDLSLWLTNRSPSFPLNIECKLIDSKSAKRVKRYCDEGLVRFVAGDYAWAGREAFMLGYVRDGSTIASCLDPFLVRSRTLSMDPYCTSALPESISQTIKGLARSSHRRTFRYLGGANNDPGPIEIWHLWMDQLAGQ